MILQSSSVNITHHSDSDSQMFLVLRIRLNNRCLETNQLANGGRGDKLSYRIVGKINTNQESIIHNILTFPMGKSSSSS